MAQKIYYTTVPGRGGRGEVYNILIDGTWMDTKQAAAAMGKTDSAIKKAIKRGSKSFVYKGITDDPHHTDAGTARQRPEVETNHKEQKDDTDDHNLPAAAGSRDLARTAPEKKPQKMEEPGPVTQSMREKALAKADTVRLWQEYVAFAKDKGLTKSQATLEFVKLFESGSYAKLKNTLGSVSKSSLYGWEKKLSAARGDYTALIPRYRVKKTGEYKSGLFEYEKNTLLAFLLSESKMNIGNATRLTRFLLTKQGYKLSSCEMTYRRFASHYEKTHYDTWIFAREGAKALKDKLAPYLTRDATELEVGDVLVADGHTLNFQVINPLDGKPCRATLIVYYDWASRDIAGYSIKLSENTAVIAEALRHSIIRMGKTPQVAYQDNGRAFRSKFFTADFEQEGIEGLFARLGIAAQFAMPYNARAKLVERFFVEFASFEKLLPSYVGQNALAKPASMNRNEKYHRAQKSDFIPTIEQTMQALESWLEFYRAQPHPDFRGKTIGEVFKQGRGKGVDIDTLDELMLKTEYKQVGRNGIRLMGADYYHEHLYAYRQKVQVRYSLHDMSDVKVYDMRGQLLCKASRVQKLHPMAGLLGDQNDQASLKKQLHMQKKLEKKTVDAHMKSKNADVSKLISFKAKEEETKQQQKPGSKTARYEDLIDQMYG